MSELIGFRNNIRPTHQFQIAIPTALRRKLQHEIKEKTIRKGEADKMAVLVREIMKHSVFAMTFTNTWVNLCHRDSLSELIGQEDLFSRQSKSAPGVRMFFIALRRTTPATRPSRFARHRARFPKSSCIVQAVQQPSRLRHFGA